MTSSRMVRVAFLQQIVEKNVYYGNKSIHKTLKLFCVLRYSKEMIINRRRLGPMTTHRRGRHQAHDNCLFNST